MEERRSNVFSQQRVIYSTFTQRLIICLSGPLLFDCLRPPRRYTHRERRSFCMISKGLIDDVVAGRKGWSSPSLTASHYFSLQHHLVFIAYWSPQSSRILAPKSKSIFHQKSLPWKSFQKVREQKISKSAFCTNLAGKGLI